LQGIVYNREPRLEKGAFACGPNKKGIRFEGGGQSDKTVNAEEDMEHNG